MTLLTGKNVIITGASRGIGLAIAHAFAAQRVKSLLLVGRDPGRLSKVREEILGKNKSSIRIRPGNVADRECWKVVVKEMKDVDILVNAAGIAHSSLLVTTSPDMVENVLETNLKGTVWGCQAVAKAMLRQKREASDTGCIINVSSLLAVKGGKGSTVYAGSKAGVLGLTRSLAAELAPSNIRVNAIVPGYIATRMVEDMTEVARSEALESIPQKRFGTSDEVAQAAVFLATNQYANNCVLNLDGGLSAV